MEQKRNRHGRLLAVASSYSLHNELNCLLGLVLVCHVRNSDLPTFRRTVRDILVAHLLLADFCLEHAFVHTLNRLVKEFLLFDDHELLNGDDYLFEFLVVLLVIAENKRALDERFHNCQLVLYVRINLGDELLVVYADSVLPVQLFLFVVRVRLEERNLSQLLLTVPLVKNVIPEEALYLVLHCLDQYVCVQERVSKAFYLVPLGVLFFEHHLQ